MIVRDFDDMRIGTIPLSKLYYGHDLIWKRKDEEADSDTLIITTVVTNYFQIPSINITYGILGTADMGDNLMGDSKVFQYTNYPIYYQYSYSTSFAIKIKAPFTVIKDEAFIGIYCKDLIKEIVIPKGVTSIGKAAFYECKNLENVILPNTLESIKQSAFRICTNLTSIKFSDSITSIEMMAFQQCISLTSVIIPNSVTIINASVFSNCSSLTSITIPDSVTFIGNSAFRNCTSLTSVIIPKSVTRIDMSAFYGTKLTSVTIAANCTYDSRPTTAGSFPVGCIVNRYPN